MDTIKNYLENMFMHLPMTDEVLRAKRELGDMMEDKYHELLEEGKTDNEAVGIVISEFGNLKEISKELGIDEIVNNQEMKENINKRTIRREEAGEYIQSAKKFFRYIGVGVMLCIYSPIVLILINALMENRYAEAYQEKIETAIGVPVLFVMIAVAVAIFIYQGMKFNKYDYLKQEAFSLDAGVERELRESYEKTKSGFILKIVVGVVMCILSVVPIIIIDVIAGGEGVVAQMSPIFLLMIVGIAVFLFITAGGEQSSYDVLLQMGDFTERRKTGKDLTAKVSDVYWSVVTAIYLIWSFVSMNWHFTWVVWPVAGILFGVIAVICKLVEKD